uniref:Tetraspanin n=1 Tax=Daphnia magna TaxID=35525 RepID=A0A0P6HTV0_9CRUS
MAGVGSGWPKSERALLCMKYFLFVFNVLSFLTAVVILTLGLWIRYDWDFKHYILELRLYQFWTGVYILIAAASIVMAISFLGCCGTIMENPTVLGLYGVLLIVCFLLEIAGVAYLLNNGTLWSNVTWWLRDRFYELIYVSDTNAREARILRIIQEEVIYHQTGFCFLFFSFFLFCLFTFLSIFFSSEIGCCGSYSSLDYINVNKPVPNECRDKATGNEYLDGCYIRMSRYLEERSGWIAGVSLFLAALQVFGITASLTMRHTLRKLESEGKVYNPVKKSKA